MDLRQFLQAVITCPEPGYFFLGLGPQHGQGWWEEWFKWPEDLEKILEKALDSAEECNVYFSTYLFREPSATKDNVLPTRTIQADLDEADILTLAIQPSILVQTSPGRHQGFWILRERYEDVVTKDETGQDVVTRHKLPPLASETHEILSRKLTYSIPNCDPSGWPLGRKVRVPFTFNWKYLEGPQHIKIVSSQLKQYDQSELELLPDPPNFIASSSEIAFLDGFGPDDYDSIEEKVKVGPLELLNSVPIQASAKSQYGTKQDDRSAALWHLLCSAFRAGCTREEVWWLGWHSANNKFAGLRYNAGKELAKDVLRAEVHVKSKIVDARSEIANARRLPGPAHERRAQLLQIVLSHLKAGGEFIHTQDDVSWYIRSDLGRPIMVTPNSEWLDMILDLQFGLNGTETDKAYVSYGLNNFCRSLPVNGMQASLSFYDQDSHSLFLHTGKKDVLRITADEVTKSTDGSYGMVFPWGVSNEPFTPHYGTSGSWADTVFKSGTSNIVGVDQDQAMALLKVWFLFILFRAPAISRPILCFLGQPGAGKSTLIRRIYTLLYGRQRSVAAVRTPESFDQAVSSDPFVALDNVDQPEKWLPDSLAMATSNSEIPRRKLYTDADPFILRRQALLGITAHNPHFTREDVADRLLLLVFERLKYWIPEGDIIQSIHDQRNKLWGQIVLDCQKVLRTPLPTYSEVPQFRVEDFARIGFWIARALECEDEFSSVIKLIGRGQKSLNLEQDHLLVKALQTYIRQGRGGQWKSAGSLWTDLDAVADDSQAFKRVYRNAVFLGKKLWALQDSLKEIFIIEWMDDRKMGSRVWRIQAKESVNGTTPESANGISGTTTVGTSTGGSTST